MLSLMSSGTYTGQEDKVLWDTAKAIELECRQNLRKWEGKEGLKKPLKNKKAARDKAYYVGLGTRVITYKSHLKIKGHLSETKRLATGTRLQT